MSNTNLRENGVDLQKNRQLRTPEPESKYGPQSPARECVSKGYRVTQIL